MQPRRGHAVLTICAFAVLYFLAAHFSYSLTVLHGGSSNLWAPAGIGVGILVLLGNRAWPAIFLGELASSVLELHAHHPLLSIALACGQTLEALTAAGLLHRVYFNPQLKRIRDVVWLLLLAAFLPSLIGATVASIATVLFTPTPFSDLWQVWHVWWLGDATGIVLVTPLLLTFATYHRSYPRGLRAVESLAFAGLIVAAITLAHYLPDAAAIALPPLLIWGAMRFGPPGAALTTAALGGVGTAVSAHLSRQWHWLSTNDRLIFTQDAFAAGALAALILAAALSERSRLLETHSRLGAFATAVAEEVEPDELFERIREGGLEMTGLEVSVVEGVERPPDEVSAPIDLGTEHWGWLVVPGLSRSQSRRRFTYMDEMLPRFASLVGLGIANTRAREALMGLATTDPLTGLANHRVFHDRLADEMERARRYGRPVAVAMIDIDNFKAINDSIGHVGGDKVLAEVASRIKGVMRTDSVVARLGGDEIAVILPESGAHGATIAVQRARLAVSATPVPPAGTVTLSGGICDSTHALTSEQIMELADDSLYWSKLHGRDTVVAYSPDLVQTLTADERAHRLTRTRALVGLKALANMIDSRIPGYTGHSERVTELVGRLAREADWPGDRIAALREAASIHDVGKLTLDERLVAKEGSFTRIEEEQWRAHPELGEQISADVLDEEQARWIRWHHERPDGRGFPDRLDAEHIPEGAALLALANEWDVMLNGRPGQAPRSQESVLETCVAQAGIQFTHEAVAALRAALFVAAEVQDS